MQLYNALNGTDYQDVSQLKVVTIESAVYVVIKNDLAFVIAGTLNLYEHQSTYNPNMPICFLIYLAEEYQKLVEQAEESLYGTKQISLPTPKCKFVSLKRRYINKGQATQDALDTAICYCIDHRILSDFIKKYRAEILGMLLEEFDVDKYERSLKKRSFLDFTV